MNEFSGNTSDLSHLTNLAESMVDWTLPDDTQYYLAQQPPSYQAALAANLEQRADNSTPAFAHNITASVGVPVPVSHQEFPYIGHTLEQYTGQDQPPGLMRTIAYLNWPPNAPLKEVGNTRDRLDTFIQDNPRVPFGYFNGQEPLPTHIGAIHKTVADTMQLLIAPEGLMICHDADTRWLSPGHIAQMRDVHTLTEGLFAGYIPRVTHERLPHLPNIDHLIQWFEDAELMCLTGRFFDAGCGFGANAYRAADGYDPKDRLAETHHVIERINRTERAQAAELFDVSEAHLVISARRLVEKLSTGYRMDQFWETEDDFGAQHNYRTTTPEQLDTSADLSITIHNRRLREFGRQTIRETVFYARQVTHVKNPEAYARTHLRSIFERLGGPMDMFVELD